MFCFLICFECYVYDVGFKDCDVEFGKLRVVLGELFDWVIWIYVEVLNFDFGFGECFFERCGSFFIMCFWFWGKD